MNDQVQQATDYIRRAMIQGVTEQEVRESLATSGWPQNLIDEGFLRYYSPTLPPAQAQSLAPVTKSHKGHSVLYASIATAIVLIVVAVGAVLFIMHSSKSNTPKTTASTKTSQSTQTTQQQTASNTSRKNDISSISAAVKNYMADSKGTFPEKIATDTKTPKVIDICGSDCTTTHETALLRIYKNSSSTVSILPYASDLKAPPLDKVYIVLGATCDGSKATLGTARQVALLYDLADGSKTAAQCQNS